MSPVSKALLRKDLLLNWPLMAGMALGGLIALALMFTGRVGYAVGGILFITSNVAGGFFIGSFAIMQERKENSHLFALSLPVSLPQLYRLKFASGLLMYLLPWSVLTAAACVTVLVGPAPQGFIVWTLLIQGSALAITVAYQSLISLSRSELASGLGILALNMTFSLFMVTISQPALRGPLNTERIVWPGYALLIFGCELLLIALAAAIALLLLSRRREPV